MLTRQHFWEVRLGICVELWVKQNARSKSSNDSRRCFRMENSRSDFDNYPCFNGFSRLKSWDFASMLGLANMSGTWDLGPRVNWPLNTYLPLRLATHHPIHGLSYCFTLHNQQEESGWRVAIAMRHPLNLSQVVHGSWPNSSRTKNRRLWMKCSMHGQKTKTKTKGSC